MSGTTEAFSRVKIDALLRDTCAFYLFIRAQRTRLETQTLSC